MSIHIKLYSSMSTNYLKILKILFSLELSLNTITYIRTSHFCRHIGLRTNVTIGNHIVAVFDSVKPLNLSPEKLQKLDIGQYNSGVATV